MNATSKGHFHWSFWAIGIVALIWNVMGIMNFIMQMNPSSLAAMSESQRAIVAGRPAWATVAFAVAVVSGSLGCVLLLLKKSAATAVFVVSLIAMLAHMIPYLGMAGSTIPLGPLDITMFIVLPLALAAFLIWYAQHVKNRGWIT